jgi:hypothetical protein
MDPVVAKCMTKVKNVDGKKVNIVYYGGACNTLPCILDAFGNGRRKGDGRFCEGYESYMPSEQLIRLRKHSPSEFGRGTRYYIFCCCLRRFHYKIILAQI